MIRRAILPLALLALIPAPMMAETALAPGDLLRQTRHWDEKTNSFLPGATKGEEDGCWQVVALGEVEVTLKHISGTIYPWWSDKPMPPGTTDRWSDSDAYRAKNPGKPHLTQIRAIFEKVASCHPTP